MRIYETVPENMNSINLAWGEDRWPDPVTAMNIRDS